MGIARAFDLAPQARQEQLVRKLGQPRSDVGVGRVLHHQVPRLQQAEFLDPAGGDAELVRVDEDVRPEFVDDAVQRRRLRQLDLDVVAIDIGVVVRRAREVMRPVGVGPRHDQYRDAVEQRLKRPRGQFPGKRQHRLPAGGLVAVLQSDQEHHRAVQPQ